MVDKWELVVILDIFNAQILMSFALVLFALFHVQEMEFAWMENVFAMLGLLVVIAQKYDSIRILFILLATLP
jgi:hypothetical protein